MKNLKSTITISLGALALGLTAGTASANTLPGSITANRADSPPVAIQRDTSTRYQPRDSAVTIGGTIDLSGIVDDGAVLIGLVDADFYDANSDNLKTYQSGAYAYFAPNTNQGAGTFAPTDGNAGGGELLDDRGSLNGNTNVGFSLTINPDGTLSVTYDGQTVNNTYGTVKARPDINGGSSTPYSADEFANGAYLAIDFASSHDNNTDETVTYNLNVTQTGANDVPEPSELGLLGLGALLIAGGLAFRRRKRPLAG